MEVCNCKHPMARHVFGKGVCTYRPPNKQGNGFGYCKCNQYTKDVLLSSKITAAILKEEGR